MGGKQLIFFLFSRGGRQNTGNSAVDSAATAATAGMESLIKRIPGIPGIPGKDYPTFTLAKMPSTSFSCAGRQEGGHYGDPGEARCQMFHVCTKDASGGLTKNSQICPIGSIFSQKFMVCDWWYKVDCSATESFYKMSEKRVERFVFMFSTIEKLFHPAKENDLL